MVSWFRQVYDWIYPPKGFWDKLKEEDVEFHDSSKNSFETSITKELWTKHWSNMFSKCLSSKFHLTDPEKLISQLAEYFPAMDKDKLLESMSYEFLFAISILSCRFDASKVIFNYRLKYKITGIQMARGAIYLMKNMKNADKNIDLDNEIDYYDKFLRSELNLVKLPKDFWDELKEADKEFHDLTENSIGKSIKDDLWTEHWSNMFPQCLSWKFHLTNPVKVESQLGVWFPGMKKNKLLESMSYEFLFAISILSCRFGASKVIFKHCLKYKITVIQMALVANYLMKNMKNADKNIDLDNEIDHYDKFLRSELNLVTVPIGKSLKKEKGWSGETCVELAERTRNRAYISSSYCQDGLNYKWDKDFSLWSVLFILTPFLLFKIDARFKHKRDEKKRLSLLIEFYSSRRVKFISQFTSYTFFLFFLSYFVLLKEYDNWISPQEYLIYVYIGALTTNEIREIIYMAIDPDCEVGKDYFLSNWNFADYLTILCGLIAGLLRIVDLSDNYIYSKTFFCLMTVFAYIRFMRFYCVVFSIGPQIFMLSTMAKVMAYFSTILIIPICAYGVVAQALLYPNTHEAPEIGGTFFYYPALQLFTLYDKSYVLASDDSCMENSTYYRDGIHCPRYHFLVIVFLFLYLLIVVVMFFNILIATFTSVYERKKQFFEDGCKFQYYSIIKELDKKFFLLLPLSVFDDICDLLVKLIEWCKYRSCCKNWSCDNQGGSNA